MNKLDIKKLAGAGTLSLGLVFGMAGFAGAMNGTIDTTGPDSNNQVTHDSRTDLDFENDTDLDLENTSEQEATSGDAEATHSTNAGDAMTGSAMNDNTVSADIMVENSSSVGHGWFGGASETSSFEATIENTGPDSNNQVTHTSSTDVEVDNNTNIDIDNDVEQSARSGDAEVSGNTNGGSAESGSVSNTSSSSFMVHVTNQLVRQSRGGDLFTASLGLKLNGGYYAQS